MTQERDKAFFINPSNPLHIIEYDLATDTLKDLKISQSPLMKISMSDQGTLFTLTSDGQISQISWDSQKKASLKSFKIKDGTF